MNDNKLVLSLSLDMRSEMDDVVAAAKKTVRAKVSNKLDRYLNLIFANPKDERDTARLSKMEENDPDLGFCHNLLMAKITDYVLSGNMEAYVERVVNEEFKKRLDQAIDKAIEHRTNKIAFQKVDKLIQQLQANKDKKEG